MAIFKKTAPVEELIAKFKKLSDEDKEKFLQMTAEDENPPSETPEVPAEAEEDRVSEESETDHNDPNDSPEEAETLESEPDAEAETPEESEPAEEEAPQPDVEALASRLAVLEEQYAKLSEQIISLLDAADNKSFGGISPEFSETDNDTVSEDDRIMKAYMAKQAYRK